VTGAIEKGNLFVSFRKFMSLYSGAPEKLVENRTTCLVDSHTAGNLRLDILHVDGVDIGLLLNLALARQSLEMRLESLAEIKHTHDGVDDGEEDEKNGDDGECSQRSANSFVVLLVTWLVNSNQLKDEVAETSEVKNDDSNHAGLVLAAGEECGGEENQNGDGDGDDGEGEFRIILVGDDDNELNDEAEEEEEIELEQSDINL
jgi:hypothetical protein